MATHQRVTALLHQSLNGWVGGRLDSSCVRDPQCRKCPSFTNWRQQLMEKGTRPQGQVESLPGMGAINRPRWGRRFCRALIYRRSAAGDSCAVRGGDGRLTTSPLFCGAYGTPTVPTFEAVGLEIGVFIPVSKFVRVHGWLGAVP
jgi:hypothetical protein